MEFPYHIITKNAEETATAGQELAQELLKKVSSASPITKEGNNLHALTLCLYGELGSGKTTFTQGFAGEFGVTKRLLSPTFVIVRRYNISKFYQSLIHVDLYRINTAADITGVGLMEMLSDPSAIIMIEWADRLGKLLPKKRIDVKFVVQEDGKHKISMRST